MRSALIAGNWKMNAGPLEAENLLKALKRSLGGRKLVSDVVVCPPFVSLHLAVSHLQSVPVQVGAQNVYHEDNGAYTGEISTSMLKEAGCDYVIIGHSERRDYFNETDELIARKVKKSIRDGLRVILCVGENLEHRKSGDQEQVVMDQLQQVTGKLTEEDASRLTIAYEPVWAIGTGETATPEQAQEMHLFIRNYLGELWSAGQLADIRILYGGSMKPGNAESLLNQPDVDGGLIGGASLKAESFLEIIDIAEKTGVE